MSTQITQLFMHISWHAYCKNTLFCRCEVTPHYGWIVKADWLPCSISGALGWAATLDILLLFYPVPRSIFLHWLMGTNFPTLIKYHRCA